MAGLPPVGAVYEPQQHPTKKLKAIIEENYYGTFFENAIKTVSEQNIPELDRIKTLDQFYYYYHEQVELVNKKLHKELVGKHLEKGEMFSYFQFGGSDCVMVFERKANLNVTAKVDVHYPIRSQYAISNINQ